MTEAWADRGAHHAVSPLHRQRRSLAKLLARPQTGDLCLSTGLAYEAAQAVRLELPMALILAVKPA